MNQIIVPLSAEEITTRWLSEALKIEISPKDFTLFTNVQAGSGFMSNVIRITCKPESDDKKVFNLIIKILPSDEAFKALVTSEKFDKTEIYFYEKIVPKLVEIVPDLKPYLCPFYYGNVQEVDQTKGHKYASVLILEDLKPQGNYTIKFEFINQINMPRSLGFCRLLYYQFCRRRILITASRCCKFSSQISLFRNGIGTSIEATTAKSLRFYSRL